MHGIAEKNLIVVERRLGVRCTYMDLGELSFRDEGLLHVLLGSFCDDDSGTIKLVSVLNEEHGQLLFLEGRQGGMAGFHLAFATGTRRRHAHVREGELDHHPFRTVRWS